MLLVVFALAAEARVFQRRLARKKKQETFFDGTMFGTRVGICFVGGRATAVAVLEETIQRVAPTLVISSGFAGATRALLEPGDFLVASNYTTAQIELPVGNLADAIGPFCSVEQVNGPAEKRRLGEFSLAVDMESRSIAAVCDRYQIPLITARMISDGRDESIPPVFIGENPRNPKKVPEETQFAFRMLHLARRLAYGRGQLIGFPMQTK